MEKKKKRRCEDKKSCPHRCEGVAKPMGQNCIALKEHVIELSLNDFQKCDRSDHGVCLSFTNRQLTKVKNINFVQLYV